MFATLRAMTVRIALSTAAFALCVGAASPAVAFMVPTVFVETPPCDPLAGPPVSDELGFPGVFPVGEHISATDTMWNEPVCLPTDIPTMMEAMVSMTNLNPVAFYDVWYVADPETGLTNVDGTVNGMPAFRIDSVGVNTPLLFESLAFNGIFEPGETWGFVIQDYTNALGLPASAFASLGVPSVGDPSSSGSIIVRPEGIPEPGAVLLIGGGLAGLGLLRRTGTTRGPR